jgi:hypothetical protein
MNGSRGKKEKLTYILLALHGPLDVQVLVIVLLL